MKTGISIILIFGFLGVSAGLLLGKDGFYRMGVSLGLLDEPLIVESGYIENVGNKICPVYAKPEQTKEEFNCVYEGKRYYFCCPECIKIFQNNPQRYKERLKNIMNEEYF